jgi:hypothetical protein
MGTLQKSTECGRDFGQNTPLNSNKFNSASYRGGQAMHKCINSSKDQRVKESAGSIRNALHR